MPSGKVSSYLPYILHISNLSPSGIQMQMIYVIVIPHTLLRQSGNLSIEDVILPCCLTFSIIHIVSFRTWSIRPR